jgi:hypothetical protein
MLGDRIPETTSQAFGPAERQMCGSMLKGFSPRDQSSGRGVPLESKFRSLARVCNG